MRHISLVSVMMASAVLASAATPRPPDKLYHDTRAIHDIVRLSLDTVANDTVHNWMLFRITPGPRSGAATVPGMYIEAETGRIVRPPANENKGTVFVVEGSWEILAVLQENKLVKTRQGKYAWTAPLTRTRSKGHSARDIYNPFVKGGIVLSRHRPDMEGAAQFDSVYLVPALWEKTLQSAYDHFRTQRNLWAGELTEDHHDRLLKLAAGGNPWVCVFAFRRLLGAERLDEGLVKKIFGQSEEHVRAAFTYLLLVHSTRGKAGFIGNLLRQLATSTEKIDELEPLMVGAFAVALFRSEIKATRQLSLEILTTLRERLGQVPAILDVMGIKAVEVKGSSDLERQETPDETRSKKADGE